MDFTLPPINSEDATVEYEVTRYEIALRRVVRHGNMTPVRIAPGQPGLNWITGFVRNQLGCTPAEADEIVNNIACAWIDANGTVVGSPTRCGAGEGEEVSSG